jgi:hypothetical protein
MLAMEKGKSGGDYIIGGENAPYDELFDLLRSIADTHGSLTQVPDFLMKSIGFVSETLAELTGKKPFLTKYGARKYTPDWIVSTRHIQDALGFKPRSLKQGLTKTINHLIRERQKKIRERRGNLHRRTFEYPVSTRTLRMTSLHSEGFADCHSWSHFHFSAHSIFSTFTS